MDVTSQNIKITYLDLITDKQTAQLLTFEEFVEGQECQKQSVPYWTECLRDFGKAIPRIVSFVPTAS